MEAQNDLLSATRIVPPAEKGDELTPGYRFLPFLAGMVAVLPTPGGTVPSGLLLGLVLFIQAWIDSAILDKDKQQRPHFKVFAEAQLIGCIGICFMLMAGFEVWHWASIALTAVYALIRLIVARHNLLALAIHFFTIPALLSAFTIVGIVFYAVCEIF